MTTATTVTPRWTPHSCASCKFLGTVGEVDVYECLLEVTPPDRTFVVRTGELPNGGLAVYSPLIGLMLKAPEGSDSDTVMRAIVEAMSWSQPQQVPV